MVVTRREFNKYAGKGLLLGGITVSLAMEGCNIAQDIVAWEPFGLFAFNNLVTALETFGVITADPGLVLIIGLIRIGFNDILQDAKLYLSLSPPPVGILAQVAEVLTLLVGNIKDLFAQISTSISSIVNLIVGLVQLILGTISGFLTKLPPPQVSLKLSAVRIGQVQEKQFTINQNRTVSYVPLILNRDQFRAAWDAICRSQGFAEVEI